MQRLKDPAGGRVVLIVKRRESDLFGCELDGFGIERPEPIGVFVVPLCFRILRDLLAEARARLDVRFDCVAVRSVPLSAFGGRLVRTPRSRPRRT